MSRIRGGSGGFRSCIRYLPPRRACLLLSRGASFLQAGSSLGPSNTSSDLRELQLLYRPSVYQPVCLVEVRIQEDDPVIRSTVPAP